ncbi:phosphoinositide-specific phospholipase C-like phosphodiesterases superfamily [Metarhizium robertsii]|uniref:LysM domain-containing protein n=2 Tax=Metarhizium robertsii TaxID=568076 RepID=E9ESA4_METRA|nr:LysM domain-containing protein [Metarhizium robertsii ARSEF 23]EFZ01621.1 LysM domain-containing protein [Metarhizium robertsii ARSEF 23]EXV01461.1 phosphoinositide-specific phospholipase C-like phosphodiesterases superfamily [Metarhizium robertsii]
MAAIVKAANAMLGLAATARDMSATKRTLDARDLEARQVLFQLERYNETHIGLINATPYRWLKTYNHSYQLWQWEKEWPEYIEPGKATSVSVKTSKHLMTDTAGEATYRIEGTSKPMSLQVQYLAGRQHTVAVQLLENLETIYSKRNTTYNLGFLPRSGGSGFILAGVEGDFISNDGPSTWMQAQLHEIGHLPLREIVMPRSHHAGQWKSQEDFGWGSAFNTQTQTLTLYEQLDRGGIRVLDVRPGLKRGKFYEHHGSLVANIFHGVLGASLEEMVDMQNKFMADHPGEMYIWDIHDTDTRDGDRKFKPLDDEGRQKLYDKLRRLNHRADVSNVTDISRRPLNWFINSNASRQGKSCLLVRVPTSWATMEHFPGRQEGFVTGDNLPLNSRWSNTNAYQTLVKDQVAGLIEARRSRSSELYNMDWLITQSGQGVVIPSISIITLAGVAWRTLYYQFWDALTDHMYPNWITMDAIHDNSLKAMAMTINKCLGVRKCGALGGKIIGMRKTTLESAPDGTYKKPDPEAQSRHKGKASKGQEFHA